MPNFRSFVSLFSGRFRGFLFLCIISFVISCNDGNTSSATTKNDSVAVLNISPSPLDTALSAESNDSTWGDASIKNVVALKQFILKLKKWSADDNRDSIAASIKYPLVGRNDISSSAQFLKEYDKVWTPTIKNLLKNQNIGELYKNFTGVKIGNGQMWIANIAETDNEPEVYKITTINN